MGENDRGKGFLGPKRRGWWSSTPEERVHSLRPAASQAPGGPQRGLRPCVPVTPGRQERGLRGTAHGGRVRVRSGSSACQPHGRRHRVDRPALRHPRLASLLGSAALAESSAIDATLGSRPGARSRAGSRRSRRFGSGVSALAARRRGGGSREGDARPVRGGAEGRERGRAQSEEGPPQTGDEKAAQLRPPGTGGPPPPARAGERGEN